MSRDMKWVPKGVIPAVLLPFHEDHSIDEPSFRAHLSEVAAAEGLSAITINAHSTEVASCSFDEQRRVLEIARDQIGRRLPIVHGVYAEGSLEAARIAKMAAEGGAAALLVFPPGPFTMGQRPEMAVEHFRRVAGAADVPIIAFQYPIVGGQGYPLATLLKIIEAVPQVAARGSGARAAVAEPAGKRFDHAQLLADELARSRRERIAFRKRIGDRRPAIETFPGGPGERSRHRARDQRSHLADSRGVLLRALGGHAQPHEGSSRHARKAAARGGAPAARQDSAGRNRPNPQGARRRGPARPGREKPGTDHGFFNVRPERGSVPGFMKIECVLECANHLGEGPVWDVEEGRLYWVDGTGRRVGKPSIWRLDPKSGKTDNWALKHDVGALALRRKGGAVLALDDGFYLFDFQSGKLDAVQLVHAGQPRTRLNDGKCDRSGR